MADEISDITPMLITDAEKTVSSFIYIYFDKLFYCQYLLPGGPSRATKYKNAITMIVLFLINLLNFMDRFAIAGIFL